MRTLKLLLAEKTRKILISSTLALISLLLITGNTRFYRFETIIVAPSLVASDIGFMPCADIQVEEIDKFTTKILVTYQRLFIDKASNCYNQSVDMIYNTMMVRTKGLAFERSRAYNTLLALPCSDMTYEFNAQSRRKLYIDCIEKNNRSSWRKTLMKYLTLNTQQAAVKKISLEPRVFRIIRDKRYLLNILFLSVVVGALLVELNSRK